MLLVSKLDKDSIKPNEWNKHTNGKIVKICNDTLINEIYIYIYFIYMKIIHYDQMCILGIQGWFKGK